ncbi:hypothetical protein ASG12_17650 [Williamsia sp. Leaf354]|jgi:hypothetical protein|uniref:hypothetical protein n=1 Tax=Williamsia sp. Leaf354 TaxID=1736349 RepID=UPI0006F4D1CE|nr:hypothetical protein [Williamsia sp. Leaf354]KQR96059.1 hypothetical protein ASG12_17650 [Williamsia sp. Leaf354]
MGRSDRSPSRPDRRAVRPDTEIAAHRPSALDRALANSRNVAIFGPLPALDRDLLTVRLRSVAAQVPRLRLDPFAADGAWTRRTDTLLVEDLAPPTATRDLPDTPGGYLGVIATHVRQLDPVPLRVAVCDDHLVVDHSHGLGDGRLAPALQAVLLDSAPPAVQAALAHDAPAGSVRRALADQILRHPRRLGEVHRLRSENARTDTVAEPVAVDPRQVRTVSATMPPDRVAALRERVSAVQGASDASATVAMWVSALHRAGVANDDLVQVLIDCRRYLRRDDAGMGNLAIALPIRMPDPVTAASVRQRVRAATESAWPLAVLGINATRARLHRGTPDPGADTAVSVRTSSRIRLSVSDIGRLPLYDGVLPGPSGPIPQLGAGIDPDGPEALTLLVSEIGGARTLSATFHPEVVAPTAVHAALVDICRDPIAVLEASES